MAADLGPHCLSMAYKKTVGLYWLICCHLMFGSIGKVFANEPGHEISNNVVCATSKCSDQPAHMHSLIRAFAGRLNIL